MDGDEEALSERVWAGDNDGRAVRGEELRLGEFCCEGETDGDGVLAKGDNGA